jgi:excisionase family DNA binding protein
MPKITKQEAAALLDKTPRAVERYAAAGRLSVTYAKGKTRDIPQYDRAEVEALAEELQNPSTPARGTVATPGDNGDQGMSQAVAIRSHALERGGSEQSMTMFVAALSDALREAQTQENGVVDVPLRDKLTLSFKEASRLSGVPESRLREAYASGVLRGAKIGRGVRVSPDALKVFIGRLLK